MSDSNKQSDHDVSRLVDPTGVRSRAGSDLGKLGIGCLAGLAAMIVSTTVIAVLGMLIPSDLWPDLVYFWALPISPALGGLVGGFLVWRIWREKYPMQARGGLLFGLAMFLLFGGCSLMFLAL